LKRKSADDIDAVVAKMLGNMGGDFTDGHLTQGFHSGLPFRLGLRLFARSPVRTSSG
jgi:hypothetical protein